MHISPDYPFESHFAEVLGSNIHYIDEGQGEPILFLHGNPTSSFLWRNVIPYVVPHGRCIAPDLIGMGRSDKPDIEYRFVDHSRYLEAFIESLQLTNITLVLHDWGSGLGFHYAMRHETNIRGIAFMEAIVRPARWSEFPADFKTGFRLFRTPGVGWVMIAVMNAFVNKVLPGAIVRELTEDEMKEYRNPYPTTKSRKPVWRWPNEIPIDGKPADMHEIIQTYSSRLQQSTVPKILFFAEPGGILREQQVQWCIEHIPNLETVHVGSGIHYLQEDNPHLIGRELARWIQGI
jgi:haloalkane dehalogenase